MNTEFAVSEPIRVPVFTTASGIAVFDHGDHFRFTLPPTDGTTGEGWSKRLGGNDLYFEKNDVKSVLRTPSFKPTKGVTTEVAVLKDACFWGNDLIMRKILAYAEAFRTPDKRKITKPNAELACLICLKFTETEIKDMGLWYIVAMHEPINVNGVPNLLYVSRRDGGLCLRADRAKFGIEWERGGGFAFEVSKTPQSAG